MKISVLTPSYNSGKYIERAIQSVVSQDYNNWEHIIVDGNSEDHTVEVLKSYPHLKWISEPDQGQSDAMNKAFSMSSGDIIVYLNADDEFTINTFKKVIKEFNDPQLDFLVGNLKRVDKDGITKILHPSIDIYRILLYWPCAFPANPVSYFYRRKVQENIGEFPVYNHLTMDYWFLLRAYQKFNIRKIEEVLGIFYFTTDNKSSNAQRAKKALRKTRNQFLLEQKNSKYLAFIIRDKLFRYFNIRMLIL